MAVEAKAAVELGFNLGTGSINQKTLKITDIEKYSIGGAKIPENGDVN